MATGTLLTTADNAGPYSYSSQPRVVQQRQKYRDDGRPSNIMYDKRIVRGNTYALHTLPAAAQSNPLELQKQQENKRRFLAQKRAHDQMRICSPPPLDGRKHIDVQTELYLEEITDRIEEADVHTQTDAFLDRPSTPLFIPAKTGEDASTQIEKGDLFDFDLEVRPILEVLVGKTVEQSLLEVMEEEELAALRMQQKIFEENRNAELVETQRLEEQERRRREEKERRMQQQREALMKERETAEKVAARAFAQGFLSDLVPAVFSYLSSNGFFYDPVERDIETSFLPWLMEDTQKLLDRRMLSRFILDGIIRDVVKKKLKLNTPTATSSPLPHDDDGVPIDMSKSTIDSRTAEEVARESKETEGATVTEVKDTPTTDETEGTTVTDVKDTPPTDETTTKDGETDVSEESKEEGKGESKEEEKGESKEEESKEGESKEEGETKSTEGETKSTEGEIKSTEGETKSTEEEKGEIKSTEEEEKGESKEEVEEGENKEEQEQKSEESKEPPSTVDGETKD